MIIELRGVEFVNKGAELMLHAILEKMKQAVPHAVFAMEVSNRSPRSKHRQHHLATITRLEAYRQQGKLKVNLSKLYDLLPARARHSAGYVASQEVDVVLDASGFAFGDQWGAKKAGGRLADHIAGWKQQGKLVIMLPQAFGPFTDPDLVRKMQTIIQHADLIFARDKTSYGYLTALASETGHIKQRPDFTNLIKGKVPEHFNQKLHGVAIIPNSKMIETSSPEEGKAYLRLLQRLAVLLQEQGHLPFFLIHESQSDQKIADTVNEQLAKPLQVVKEENPLYVKGIIGASQAVITSRFHGLVSCLSQGVPCLSTGWSHKYEMLLQDYHYPEALLDVHCDEQTLQDKVHMILQDPERTQIAEKLRKAAGQQKQLSEQMWQEVFEKIKK